MKKIILTLTIAFVSYNTYAISLDQKSINSKTMEEEASDCMRINRIYDEKGNVIQEYTEPC